MNRWLSPWIPVAEADYWENVARGFRGYRTDVQPSDIVFGLLIVVIAVMTLWLLARLSGADDRRQRCDRPWMLFLSLCRAHRLRWSDWWLLLRVARHQRLREPARIFLEPERLETANLSPSLKSRAQRLCWLRGHLFARSQETQRQPPDVPGGGQAKRPIEQPAICSDGIARQEEAVEADHRGPAFPLSSSPALDIPPWVLSEDSGAEPPRTEVS